jgi:hypothetical protein
LKIRINFDFLNEMLNNVKSVWHEFKKLEKENSPSSWIKEVNFEEGADGKKSNSSSSSSSVTE